MSIYVYIDESEKLFDKERYQNFTAVAFTGWDLGVFWKETLWNKKNNF